MLADRKFRHPVESPSTAAVACFKMAVAETLSPSQTDAPPLRVVPEFACVVWPVGRDKASRKMVVGGAVGSGPITHTEETDPEAICRGRSESIAWVVMVGHRKCLSRTTAIKPRHVPNATAAKNP